MVFYFDINSTCNINFKNPSLIASTYKWQSLSANRSYTRTWLHTDCVPRSPKTTRLDTHLEPVFLRARRFLAVIGCRELLEMDGTWRKYIEMCDANNATVWSCVNKSLENSKSNITLSNDATTGFVVVYTGCTNILLEVNIYIELYHAVGTQTENVSSCVPDTKCTSH